MTTALDHNPSPRLGAPDVLIRPMRGRRPAALTDASLSTVEYNQALSRYLGGRRIPVGM